VKFLGLGRLLPAICGGVLKEGEPIDTADKKRSVVLLDRAV